MSSKAEYKTILTGIVIGILVGAGACYLIFQYPVEGLEEEISLLREQILDAMVDLGQLQGQLKEVKDNIERLETEKLELQSQKEQLQGQLKEAKDDLSTTQSSFQDLIKSYDMLEENYEKLRENYELLIGEEEIEEEEEIYEGWCEIGVPYVAADGLTVTLTSFTINEKIGSYQYTINYILSNHQPDKAIYEGTFKMYYANESGGLPQYGFFGELFPGDALARTYTFEELKGKPFSILEYHHEHFFSSEPLEDSLKWKVEIP